MESYASAQNKTQTQTAMGTEESASWIRDAVGYSEQMLSELHEHLNALERRLEPALTPSGPTLAAANQAPKNPNANGSHLRGRIVILNEGWQHAIERVQSLRQRVEI